nr:carbamoyltransferase HypF [Propionivibrio soli]
MFAPCQWGNGASIVSAGHNVPNAASAERIRVRGAVQGVGFRPMVWRLANDYGLRGWVGNDGQGVTIYVRGNANDIDMFARELPRKAPPLSRIVAIDRERVLDSSPATENGSFGADAFSIVESAGSAVRTQVVADAATCPECLAEITDPTTRRHGYAFTNCTHCGPRLSIIEAIPYDRQSTTMRDFQLCRQCAAEYAAPADRRFHAQPIACPVCGPRLWLEKANGNESAESDHPIEAACAAIEAGDIVAIKGLGGFQLACDAADAAAVDKLRRRKQRERKPFALMARDIEMIRRYCKVDEAESALLLSPAAPIVILERHGRTEIADGVAPGVSTLGFMLPNTPLHHLLLRQLKGPVILTSGNLSDEPQGIDNDDARERLGAIADHFLMHNRGIARRVDDSVVRVMAGEARLLRRARGYAPAPIRLPEGFSTAVPILALGGELKNTFCLLCEGEAVLSHHIGDLADARCHADYLAALADYRRLFEHEPRIVAVDRHPEYLSRKLGLEMATEEGIPCVEVQHHHAHIAACMAENGVELTASPVLGICLDGLGYGDDGLLWGGEIVLADYCQYRRLASLQPVAMPGGARAIREPWRNTYAHLMAAVGRKRLEEGYGTLDLWRFLASKPTVMLDGMIARGINSPRASSCGRLFDAVAAAAGVCCEEALYEGQAAVEFEALVDRNALAEEDMYAYSFGYAQTADGLLRIDPAPMWMALLDDLRLATPVPLVAARFHKGLAIALARIAEDLVQRRPNGGPMGGPITTAALSGGVFQNRVLLEQVLTRLRSAGFDVMTHRQVPAHDGGIALGQAAIAAARVLAVQMD